MTSIGKQIEFRENLQAQLDAANQQIAALQHALNMAGSCVDALEAAGMGKFGPDTLAAMVGEIIASWKAAKAVIAGPEWKKLLNGKEAAERKLATAHEAWEAIKPLIRDSIFYQKGPLGNQLDHALAQIEQPQEQP